MTRIEELKNELEKVCGTYENNCNHCPRQKECGEYCKLSQIEEIVNKLMPEIIKGYIICI